jgi:uncharacterized repeat protein (TIGR01451 family)
VDFRFASGDPRFSDTAPGVGDTVTVSGTVTNAGGKNAQDVDVRFTDDGVTFADVRVPTLNAGQSASVSAPLSITKGGAQAVRIAADPDAAYVDENPADNAASATLDVRAPDFAFAGTDPTFSNARPGIGDTVTVGATLQNLGGKPGSDVVVRFLDDGTVFSEQTVASLASGASQALSASLTVEGERNHVIKVVADPDAAIAEENEANNEASKLLNVRFTAPDLALGSPDPAFSDAEPGVGDTITVSVTLSNAGEKPAVGSVVRFLDDGTAFADVTVASLDVGASAQVSAPLDVRGLHTHTVRVVADPDNAIQEEDEANNEVSKDLPVTAPDLAIGGADLRPGDPNPDEADVLTLSVTVHNLGPKAARDALVQVLDDGVPAASATVTVPGSGSAVAEPSWQVGRVGPHNLTVTVDPLDAIVELDETNNQAVGSIVVGKVQVMVTMTKDLYGVQEQASGVAHLQFRHSGAPLVGQEVTIPVEYILRPATLSGIDLPNLVEAVAALLAQVRGGSDQVLSICVLGSTCVNSTVDQAIDFARTFGGGLGAGSDGVEVRYRVATLQATTDLRGDAAFDVPFSLAGGFDGAAGTLGANVCLDGVAALGTVNGILAGAGQPPLPSCASQLASVPALPSVANLPGTYRATADMAWYGFPFAGSAEWQHL